MWVERWRVAQGRPDAISPDSLAAYSSSLRRIVKVAGDADLAEREDLLARLTATLEEARTDAGRARWLSVLSRISLRAFGSSVMGISGPQGDLDVSLEGEVGEQGPGSLWTAERIFKVNLLREVHLLLGEGGNFAEGEERQLVTKARYPISRFVEAQTRLQCDLSIGNTVGVFKSELLGAALGVDPRLGNLAMLAKAWARGNGVNDPANGSFNSYCLTLLVVAFAQTRVPPLLPPFMDLFSGLKEAVAEGGAVLDRVDSFRAMAVAWDGDEGRPRNHESLIDLFMDFLGVFCGLVEESQQEACAWAMGWGSLCRMSAAPWEGGFQELKWEPRAADSHHLFVRDPFECHHDNCARTLKTWEWEGVVQLLHNTNQGIRRWVALPASEMEASWEGFMDYLFKQGPEPPQLQERAPPVAQWATYLHNPTPPPPYMAHQILEGQSQGPGYIMGQQAVPALQQQFSQVGLNPFHQGQQQQYHQGLQAFPQGHLPGATMNGTGAYIPKAWVPGSFPPPSYYGYSGAKFSQLPPWKPYVVPAAVNPTAPAASSVALDAVAKPVQVDQEGHSADSELQEDAVILTKVDQMSHTVDGTSAEAVEKSKGRDRNSVAMEENSETSGSRALEGSAGLREGCLPHSASPSSECEQPLPVSKVSKPPGFDRGMGKVIGQVAMHKKAGVEDAGNAGSVDESKTGR